LPSASGISWATFGASGWQNNPISNPQKYPMREFEQFDSQ